MNDELKRQVWDKATEIDGLDPALFRTDVCGAIMSWTHYNQDSSFGWVVDHIYPISKGGDDSLINLRAMNIANARAKGDAYPVYRSAVTKKIADNVPYDKTFRVNRNLQNKLAELYGFDQITYD